jgi:hypothetical protein
LKNGPRLKATRRLIVKKRGVFKTPYSLKEKSEAPQAAKLTLFRRLLVDSIAGIAVGAILTSSPGPQKLKTPSMACSFRAPLSKNRRAQHSGGCLTALLSCLLRDQW